MQPYQQRAVDEMRDLGEKCDNLAAFILGEAFKTLPRDEQNRMRRQMAYMTLYLIVLSERVAVFAAA